MTLAELLLSFMLSMVIVSLAGLLGLAVHGSAAKSLRIADGALQMAIALHLFAQENAQQGSKIRQDGRACVLISGDQEICWCYKKGVLLRYTHDRRAVSQLATELTGVTFQAVPGGILCRLEQDALSLEIIKGIA